MNFSINKNVFNLSSVFLFLGVCTVPLYFLPSGTMQISDWLIVIYSIYYLVSHGFKLNRVDYLLLILVCYVFTREVIASVNISQEDWSFITQTSYITFAFIIFQIFRRIVTQKHQVNLFRRGVLIATVLAVLGLFFFKNDPTTAEAQTRAIGTFNNPNQLGYFAVCMFSINASLILAGQTKRWVYFLSIIMCVFLASASLSKAAIVSLLIGSVFSGFVWGRGSMRFVSGTAIFAGVIGLAMYVYLSGAFDDWLVIKRLTDIGEQSDDSLAGRGYIPWFNQGVISMLFGLSKPETTLLIGLGEVHSTIASFFIYYGLVGGLAFLTLIFLWVQTIWSAFRFSGLILVCIPPLLYGLTHNGSRFTFFWILLASSFALARKATQSSEEVPRDDSTSYSGSTVELVRQERMLSNWIRTH